MVLCATNVALIGSIPNNTNPKEGDILKYLNLHEQKTNY